LSSGAKEPPTYESRTVPVCGLLQPTTSREHVVTPVPAKGPVKNIKGFCADRESRPGVTSSRR
jgi:hypothetical protein